MEIMQDEKQGKVVDVQQRPMKIDFNADGWKTPKNECHPSFQQQFNLVIGTIVSTQTVWSRTHAAGLYAHRPWYVLL